MIQRTLCLVKPDATERNLIGAILKMIQESGLKICAMKMVRLTKAQAQGFYAVHSKRPFFESLTDFMCSGPVAACVLEGENAIQRYREVMGATNPAEAAQGTIRKLHALDLEKNSVHGSDAPETAAFEIAYFFNALEITA